LKLSPNKEAFFRDKNNYNSCLNIQLIEKSENESKGDMPLQKWAKHNKKSPKDLLVRANTSLEIKDFEKFINDRRKMLKKRLKKILDG
jgi:hypothetical protein